jgi:hypothetical protein
MTKRAILAATAILVSSFNPVLVTPAFAVASPITDPQEFCEDQLKPNDPNSEFQTESVDVVEGDWVTVNTELGDPIGDPYGVGTPTATGIQYNGTYIRHGGSPNVWGEGSANLVYPQTGQMYETLLDQERSVTFGCHVWKYVGNENDILVEPPGLQTTGNTVTQEQQIPGDPQEVVTDDDFIVYGETVVALICISPNNTTKSKPGTWTAKHGFTGSCTEASTLAGGDIPSNNAPTSDDGIVYFPH